MDAENRRKEGRGFYKMHENNIQLLHEHLTEEFHALAKSHTTTIEQLLEDFNDDPMLFPIEAEAYEEERIHTERQTTTATQNIAPTAEEQTLEPLAATHTTKARQEGTSPATTITTPEQQEEETTLPKPAPTCKTQRRHRLHQTW